MDNRGFSSTAEIKSEVIGEDREKMANRCYNCDDLHIQMRELEVECIPKRKSCLTIWEEFGYLDIFLNWLSVDPFISWYLRARAVGQNYGFVTHTLN